MPAFGYDYVPGNLAGALALTRGASGHAASRSAALTATVTARRQHGMCQSSTFVQRPIHRVCGIAQGTRHHMGVQIHGDRS